MKFSSSVGKRIQYIIAIMLLLYVSKPSFFFKPNGKPRTYGVGFDDDGYKKTLYSFQFAIFVIAIMLTLLVK